jgi:hypothetical protein
VTKLTIRVGDAAIEYDGPEDFLKAEMSALVAATRELQSVVPPKPPSFSGPSDTPGDVTVPTGAEASVSTLSQKLSIDSGPDLLEAAALALALDGRASFAKKDLRSKAREAKTFWKKSYGNNFDNYLKRLVTAGRLNHVSGDDYALPDAGKTKLLARVSAKP